MPKIRVAMIDRIDGSAVSAEGDHMLLRLRTADGSDMALGLACDQIEELLDHCALARTESERVTRSGTHDTLAVNWWNSAIDRKSGQFTLMLTFGLGGTLSFGLSEHMAQALLTTLQALYGTNGVAPTSQRSATGYRADAESTGIGFR